MLKMNNNTAQSAPGLLLLELTIIFKNFLGGGAMPPDPGVLKHTSIDWPLWDPIY
jgi:hypothetical protein